MTEAFRVPEARRDRAINTFHFLVAQKPILGIPRKDKHYTIPTIEYLPRELLEPLRDASARAKQRGAIDQDVALAIWELWLRILDRYAPGEREKLSDDQIAVTLRAYQEQSTMAAGESSASSRS